MNKFLLFKINYNNSKIEKNINMVLIHLIKMSFIKLPDNKELSIDTVLSNILKIKSRTQLYKLKKEITTYKLEDLVMEKIINIINLRIDDINFIRQEYKLQLCKR